MLAYRDQSVLEIIAARKYREYQYHGRMLRTVEHRPYQSLEAVAAGLVARVVYGKFDNDQVGAALSVSQHVTVIAHDAELRGCASDSCLDICRLAALHVFLLKALEGLSGVALCVNGRGARTLCDRASDERYRQILSRLGALDDLFKPAVIADGNQRPGDHILKSRGIEIYRFRLLKRRRRVAVVKEQSDIDRSEEPVLCELEPDLSGDVVIIFPFNIVKRDQILGTVGGYLSSDRSTRAVGIGLSVHLERKIACIDLGARDRNSDSVDQLPEIRDGTQHLQHRLVVNVADYFC